MSSSYGILFSLPTIKTIGKNCLVFTYYFNQGALDSAVVQWLTGTKSLDDTYFFISLITLVILKKKT